MDLFTGRDRLARARALNGVLCVRLDRVQNKAGGDACVGGLSLLKRGHVVV